MHGQLGLKTVDDKLLPSHVALLDGFQVSFVAAGYGHSAVLTSQGQVLTFGNGTHTHTHICVITVDVFRKLIVFPKPSMLL